MAEELNRWSAPIVPPQWIERERARARRRAMRIGVELLVEPPRVPLLAAIAECDIHTEGDASTARESSASPDPWSSRAEGNEREAGVFDSAVDPFSDPAFADPARPLPTEPTTEAGVATTRASQASVPSSAAARSSPERSKWRRWIGIGAVLAIGLALGHSLNRGPEQVEAIGLQVTPRGSAKADALGVLHVRESRIAFLGQLDEPIAGAPVHVVDDAGRALASTTTGESGEFEVRLQLEAASGILEFRVESESVAPVRVLIERDAFAPLNRGQRAASRAHDMEKARHPRG